MIYVSFSSLQSHPSDEQEPSFLPSACISFGIFLELLLLSNMRLTDRVSNRRGLYEVQPKFISSSNNVDIKFKTSLDQVQTQI